MRSLLTPSLASILLSNTLNNKREAGEQGLGSNGQICKQGQMCQNGGVESAAYGKQYSD